MTTSRVERYPDHEVCPSCGGFFLRLHDLTGWCQTCTAYFYAQPVRHCHGCDQLLPETMFRPASRWRCRSCESAARRRQRHADPEAARAYDRERKRRLRAVRTGA
jgi:rRNA maturation endonuclease Nob1